jgi:hypothetical protein
VIDRASLIGEYALIELVVAWPLLLAGSLALAGYLRVTRQLSWATVSYALGFAWLLSLIGGLAVWTFWPAAIGGPMLANYVHGPVLVAALLAFPLMAWVTASGRHTTIVP